MVICCARYAAGKDYHNVFRKKLAQLGKKIVADTGGQSRATVDSAPLDERQVAERAGLGWRGKNALILQPKRGSYHFLGCVLTTVHLEPHNPGLSVDRCGSCRNCERDCPTAALVDRRVLSERCISYLTIEHQGVIARDLAQHFQGWWFGCDVCQMVCPWNRFADGTQVDERLRGHDAEQQLLAIRADQFDAYFAGRAVRRTGYERFRRNLLVAYWSLGKMDICQRS